MTIQNRSFIVSYFSWPIIHFLLGFCLLTRVAVMSSLIKTQPGSSKAGVSEIHDRDQGMNMLLQTAHSFSAFFRRFVEGELGTNITKHFFQSTSFDTRHQSGLEDQAKLLGNNFSVQVDAYVESVERLASAIKYLSISNDSMLLRKCCELSAGSVQYDAEYKTEIRRDMACWYPVSQSKANLFVPSLFSQAMLKNSMKWPYLRWQYFVSPEGIYVEYPANRQNCHMNSATSDGPRPSFIPKNHPERKMWLIQKSRDDSRIHRLVFLIQLGHNPTSDVMNSMKSIVLMLLRFLDEANEVGILNIDTEGASSEFACGQLVAVTPWTRYQVVGYLNHIEQRYKAASTKTSDGWDETTDSRFWALNKSLEIACTNISVPTQFPPSAATVVHLTTALYSNQSKSAFQIKSVCPVFVETYLLGKVDDDDESKFKTQLQRSSPKNIWNVQVHSASQMEPESFAIKVALKMNSKKELWSLSDILSQFFPEEASNSSNKVDFSVPHWNPVSKEPVIVAKKYVFYKGRALGLVAVEIPVVHFTQQILYYLNENEFSSTNYAFLVDATGRVIAHPSIGKPGSSEEPLLPIQIEQVEVQRGFPSLKKRLLSASEPVGCQSLKRVTKNDWVTYAWSRVGNYVVVLVAFGENGGCFPDREEMVLKKSWLSPKADVQHHLLLTTEYCCGKQGFSVNKAALYLSPSAFTKAAAHISSHQPVKQSMAIMAFLSDNSGLLRDQNKGLKTSVKHNIGVMCNVLPTWKAQFQKSIWKKYIHKRFVAGGGGTFLLIHPGVTLTSVQVPHSASWFRRSVNGNGKIIFSPPKINSVGTPISTITIAVDVGGTKVVTVAILGATVSIGFFEKILTDNMADCEQPTKPDVNQKSRLIRCVLIDERGFVVYHHRLAKTMQLTSTVVHLTQIEPLSAIDILQFGAGANSSGSIPLQKQTCHKLSPTSPTQESLQRFYTLAIPPDGIQKIKAGEVCNQYQIVPIPGTNLFLARIHDNCSSTVAFCPCSTVDNLCLNCLRIEPSDCECPCECPAYNLATRPGESNPCTTHGFTDLPGDVESCEFPGESMSLDGSACGNYSLTCNSLWTQCEEVLQRGNCIGVHDCTWCEVGTFAQCTTFEQCYGFVRGVKGEFFDNAIRLFVDNNVVSLEDGKQSIESQITIVPILAVLGVFLIFLTLVVYCYRHRALRSSFSQPDVSLLPLQDSPMGSVVPQAGSSRSNSDTEGEIGPVPAMHRYRHFRHAQNPQILPPPISRSPLGSIVTESDHGYSTMSQIEDYSDAGAVPVLYSIEQDPLNGICTLAINQPPEDTNISPHTINVHTLLTDTVEPVIA